ncbi:MAG: GntR family transcriptional regulator [Actinobacteria bacterium]|nr:GntR family transcriptional regulator [Actinomycetota bacterium]
MEGRTGVQMPTTRNATVLNHLREEIYDGTLPPGTRLRQAHIAERFGVSTTPIREAFAALEREGLLQSTAHRGVVVFRPTAHDMREIYEVRIPLEVHATELAVPNLDRKALDKLAKLAADITKFNHKGDLGRSNELNDQFHASIYAAADRPRLADLIADLRSSSKAYTQLFDTQSTRIEETEKEHGEILAACEAGSAKKAGKAVEKHLLHTLRVVAPALEE